MLTKIDKQNIMYNKYEACVKKLKLFKIMSLISMCFQRIFFLHGQLIKKISLVQLLKYSFHCKINDLMNETILLNHSYWLL